MKIILTCEDGTKIAEGTLSEAQFLHRRGGCLGTPASNDAVLLMNFTEQQADCLFVTAAHYPSVALKRGNFDR